MDGDQENDQSLKQMLASADAGPVEKMIEDEQAAHAVKAIRAAIQNLSEERREILLLVNRGLTYEQIAERLGIELGTVRSRIHRASSDLQNNLKSHGLTEVDPEKLTSRIAGQSGWRIHEKAAEHVPRTVEDLIAILPPFARELAELRFYYNLPITSVARVLGRPRGTVSGRLAGIKQQLGEWSEAHGIDLPPRWNVPAIRYNSLEEVANSLRHEGQAETVAREVILKGRDTAEVAAEMGLELSAVTTAARSTAQAMLHKMEMFGLTDPRLARWDSAQKEIRTLEEAVAQLPSYYRDIMRLKLIEGLNRDVDTIANQLGLTNQEVNARTQKAKEQLIRILRENKITDPRSGHLYMRPPTTVAEAIWQVSRVHQPLLRLKYLQGLSLDEIRKLDRFRGKPNLARAMTRADEALKTVTDKYGLAKVRLASPKQTADDVETGATAP